MNYQIAGQRLESHEALDDMMSFICFIKNYLTIRRRRHILTRSWGFAWIGVVRLITNICKPCPCDSRIAFHTATHYGDTLHVGFGLVTSGVRVEFSAQLHLAFFASVAQHSPQGAGAENNEGQQKWSHEPSMCG